MTATPGATSSRPVGSATQSFGLALVGVAAIVYLGGGLLGAQSGTIPFLVIVAVVAIVGAIVAARFPLWGTIVGLLATIATGGMVFWFVFGLFAFNSVIEFTGGLLFVFGVVLGLVGGIRALVKRRDPRASPTEGERRTRAVITAIVGVGAVVSFVLGMVMRNTVSAEEAQGAQRVDMDAFEYVPETLEVAAGQVSFVFHNSDAFTHSFTLDEAGVDEFVAPGSESLVTFDIEPGTYTFYCFPHANKSDGFQQENDMIGTLVVR